MATTRPENTNQGWNDPPRFSYSPGQPSPRRTALNKRVAFPLAVDVSKPNPDNAALLNPENGPPLSPVQLLPPATDTSTPTPVPLLIPVLGQHTPPSNILSKCTSQQLPQSETVNDVMKKANLNSDEDLHQSIHTSLEKLYQSYSLTSEGKNDDIQKRLKLFHEAWQNGQITDDIKIKMFHLTEALMNSDYEKANELHLSLIVDHISQVNHWIVGVKRLIQETKRVTEEALQNTTDNENVELPQKASPQETTNNEHAELSQNTTEEVENCNCAKVSCSLAVNASENG